MSEWYTKGRVAPRRQRCGAWAAISRRDALAVFAAAALPETARAASHPAGLRELAGIRGVLYGAAVTSRQLAGGGGLVAALRAECAAVVPEYEMKWHVVERVRGRRDLRNADAIVSFAEAEGWAVRGHALLWPSQGKLPSWIETWPEGDASGLQAAVDAHIADLTGRYRGRVASWDVVNEAIEAQHGRADGLRRSVLLDRLGERHIDHAFAVARTADATANLIYNDYGVEHEIPWQIAKRAHVLGLLERMVSRGAAVQGLGIQAHLRVGAPFDPDTFGRFLDRVTALGLRIEITELDVEDRDAPAEIAVRDGQVADLVRRFLDVCLARKAVTTLVTWGLSDATSWLADPRWGKARPDGMAARPLPLDAQFARKPMWHTIEAALAAAPRR